MTALKLSDILRREVQSDPLISDITADSRAVRAGALFCALPGGKVDGRSFIPQAVAQGAAAILASEDTPEDLAPVLVRANDVRRAYALAARAFYGAAPRRCLAVTGTNGKTSVAGFARQIGARLGLTSGSLGTLGAVVQTPTGEERALTGPGLTSPDAGTLARLLSEMAGQGVSHLTVEASSHGLDQRRLDGVALTAAAFTNLTQDHLDYHGDMNAYRKAKLRLFDSLLPRGRTAVLNADDAHYNAFASAAILAGQSVFSVGARGRDLTLLERRPTAEGQTLIVELNGARREVRLPLAGAFQASNALVAAGLCIAAGEDGDRVLAALEHLQGAAGRLQRIGSKPSGGEIYIDYAHTPDGLETVLKSLRPHVRGRLLVVFGCGGDRDRSKRPIMGEIAGRCADIAIVTDDNPRSEDPAAIRAEVLKGAPHLHEIGDRRAAIFAAASKVEDGDILLIAGKGHEQGQIVGGVVHPFDDAKVASEALAADAAPQEDQA